MPDVNNCFPAGTIVDGSLSCVPASLPVRLELAQGPVTVSLVGYTLSYNTLDNVNSPTSGLFASLTQDVAGVGGDVNFVRTTGEVRNYYEVLPDVVGVLHLQGGHETGWGGKDLRMLDHFFMGPNLVRGFAPAGIGPRDLTPGTTNDALGGSMYWGSSVEFQTPLYFLPQEIGIKFAVFADAGSLWDYKGPTSGSAPAGSPVQTVQVGLDKFSDVRSSIGAGLIWDSPLGPLRVDVAYPITKYCDSNRRCSKFAIARRFSASAAAPSSSLAATSRHDERACLFKIRPRPHARRGRKPNRRRAAAGIRARAPYRQCRGARSRGAVGSQLSSITRTLRRRRRPPMPAPVSARPRLPRNCRRT